MIMFLQRSLVTNEEEKSSGIIHILEYGGAAKMKSIRVIQLNIFLMLMTRILIKNI